MDLEPEAKSEDSLTAIPVPRRPGGHRVYSAGAGGKAAYVDVKADSLELADNGALVLGMRTPAGVEPVCMYAPGAWTVVDALYEDGK